VVLGLNATLTLALSFSLVKSLRSGKPNGLDHPLYWRRALLAATSARALADAIASSHGGRDLFSRPCCRTWNARLGPSQCPISIAAERLQRDHAALAEVERKRLQTDHAEIGGWLMRTWNLPERCILQSAIATAWNWRSRPNPTKY